MKQRKGQSATEYLMTYGWAMLAIVFVAGVMWNMGLFGGDTEETAPFEIFEKWDYGIYWFCLNQPCFDDCISETEIKLVGDAYDYCVDKCTPKKMKLYSDSYCNITCDDANITLNINVPDYHAIPAQEIMVNNTNCSSICYGIFVGFTGEQQ